MVDLQGQYHRLKEEIDAAMQTVIESSAFINGPQGKLLVIIWLIIWMFPMWFLAGTVRMLFRSL